MLTPVFNNIPNTAVETNSLDFESSSNQYLSMTVANFGATNSTKIAFSFWFKKESSGSQAYVIQGGSPLASLGWLVYFDSSNRLNALFSTNSVSGSCTTTMTFDSGRWYHAYVVLDMSLPSDRIYIKINGSAADFSSYTEPEGFLPALTGQSIYIGALISVSTTSYFDGLYYQLATFSGTIPAVSELINGNMPKDIRSVTGLHSLLDGSTAVSDYVLASDWTNVNTVTTSVNIPS